MFTTDLREISSKVCTTVFSTIMPRSNVDVSWVARVCLSVFSAIMFRSCDWMLPMKRAKTLVNSHENLSQLIVYAIGVDESWRLDASENRLLPILVPSIIWFEFRCWWRSRRWSYRCRHWGSASLAHLPTLHATERCRHWRGPETGFFEYSKKRWAINNITFERHSCVVWKAMNNLYYSK